MKKLVFAWLLALAGIAQAQGAPVFLYATEASPFDTATISVNGAGAFPCVVGVNPSGNIKCPLDSITAPGTYTLAIKVVQNPGTVVTAGGATTSPGGSAVSAPFLWTLAPSVVAPPGLPKIGS